MPLDFFEAGRNLTLNRRKFWITLVGGLSSVLVLLVVFLAGKYATLTVPAESPLWEMALQFRLIAARMFVALALIPAGIFLAFVAHSSISKTEKARRHWTWAIGDTSEVRAAKTSNSGRMLDTLMLAIVLGLLLGVLR